MRPRVALLGAGLLLVAAGCDATAPEPPGGPSGEPAPVSVPGGVDTADPVLGWFDVTAAAVDGLGSPVQSPRSALWATAWSAADRALTQVAADRLPARTGPAALATAVHDVLVARVPAVRAAADAQLDATLAAVPDGPDADRALARGAEAAAEVLDERAGDGLSAEEVAAGADDLRPRPGPGSWVPTTTGARPSQPALGAARPFLVDPDRVAVPAPPAVGSARYREDLAEVRALGARTGSRRTSEQTATALFWADDSLTAYTQVLRGLLAQDPGPTRALAERVGLVALFHEATTDAQIVCFAAKYDVRRWRPVTAIREAGPDGSPLPDGDPLTVPEPGWEPLLETPSHPEYPSAHTVYAGAAEVVLDALVGVPDRPVPVDVAGRAPRVYSDWTVMVEENVEARVASGIHYRTSDEVGARLGRDVARLAVAADGLRPAPPAPRARPRRPSGARS